MKLVIEVEWEGKAKELAREFTKAGKAVTVCKLKCGAWRLIVEDWV